MSGHREEYTASLLNLLGASSGSITVLEKDASGLVTRAKCATGAIPNAVAGYAIGCLVTDTTTGKIYQNLGTAASCTFNSIGDIAAGEITLTEGSILVGNNSGVAAALSAKGDTKILIGNGTTITSATVSGDITLTNAGVVAIGAGRVLSSMLASGAGVAALLTAGLGGSKSVVKTDAGTSTVVAAHATKDRAVLGIVVVDEAFATGNNAATVITIGETNTLNKGVANTLLVNGVAAGAVFAFAFTNTATKAITITATAAAGTGTGGCSVTVLAIPTT